MTSLSSLRILAIGAHPDDVELQCAGTLAKYIQAGAHVIMAIATDGSAGHKIIPPTELVPIRKEEAQKSAAILGAEFHWLGVQDEFLFEDLPTRLLFIDLIRLVRPDIILTHNPDDYHPDHRAVNHLVFGASFPSSLPNVSTSQPVHPVVPPIYYFDSYGSANFNPQEFVDITDTYEVKKQMLTCHQSQLKWLKDHDKVDVLETMYIQARFRGIQCGVQFAEGFTHENVFPRIKPERLLP
jgi:LmbE family N-acetylglucosaminyl deacetylase